MAYAVIFDLHGNEAALAANMPYIIQVCNIVICCHSEWEAGNEPTPDDIPSSPNSTR